ncbi:DUF4124 domain-containing protein [Pseudomonas sp. 10B1]|uniref:DUF4124 domain-containing protein n=1 Tax=unclassified Pseudomonas TaxID=196821 RepID=UPI002AB5375E|nr:MULTISPECIES: DUF4124 domain-containing protein [unclassified Pseudomonas]MDY7563387.1 DUF4124 domain-containing protein [Pseudomonas sp. AB6]MEA9978254.1 DUF4124 domain-containing protein [Pseudomonas sp. RTS4]MEA9995146.1 DUF4124 domain-containing protein [Pseudomonas sp. AA4]MEB0086893.1 DUF4124 domain-containing protein [Pseudomonas sp. RTI1]MEB0127355.1 DUF4124 domain-containing protein [Pseudomonas sp. CCC1.2]
MRCMILAAALLCSLNAVCQAGQIYKWVDAQGQTHFDAQPPPNQAAQQIDIKQSPPMPARAVPQAPLPDSGHGNQDAIDAKVKKQVAVQEAKRAAYCEDVRTNLAQFRNNPRVRLEVSGVMRRLTEEERQTRIAETEKAIADNCQ